MHRIASLALLAALTASPALAWSDGAEDGATSSSEEEIGSRPVQYQQTTTLEEGEFGTLEVEGELIRPQGTAYFVPQRKSFPSWIQLRTDFDQELRDSVEQLR